MARDLCERFLGLCTDGLQELPGSPGFLALPAVCDAFGYLRDAAGEAGFDLRAESAFRSFDRQVSLWNAKARGERPLLDRKSQPMDSTALTPRDRVAAIMLWSALPGTSRHHMGTDIDIVDAAALPPDYEVQLIPEEVADNGIFGPLHKWLDGRIARNEAFGFFRPYTPGRGGIRPERWHISHQPSALELELFFDEKRLRRQLRAAQLELVDEVLADLPRILETHVIPYFGGAEKVV